MSILPITTLHELDAGPYIDGGLLLSRDPELGHYNLGVFRHMLQKKDQLGVQFSETAQTHYIYKKYKRKGEKMEVAICIGHHPAFTIGGVANTPPEVDQYEVCGALLREPVQLVKCETVDLEVPANCEIVIEGYILPRVLEYEAPYGEYPGTYEKRRLNPIIKVTAITMRHDAIYQNGFSGLMEGFCSRCWTSFHLYVFFWRGFTSSKFMTSVSRPGYERILRHALTSSSSLKELLYSCTSFLELIRYPLSCLGLPSSFRGFTSTARCSGCFGLYAHGG